MRRGRIGVIAVAAVAIGIVAYKQLRPVAPPASEAAHSRPTVLLFADPREADSSCGCGQVIRLVRGAGARGVPVQEVSPGSAPALERQYQVTVAPVIVILNGQGQVVGRLQGESPEVIASVRAALGRLPGAMR